MSLNKETLASKSGNLVAIKCWNEKLVTAEQDGGLSCNRAEIGDWEKWTILANAGGTFSFKSFHGSYLASEPSGNFVANGNGEDEWAKFRLEENDSGQLALRSSHEFYLSAQPAGNFEHRTRAAEWEYFYFTAAGDQSIVSKVDDPHPVYSHPVDSHPVDSHSVDSPAADSNPVDSYPIDIKSMEIKHQRQSFINPEALEKGRTCLAVAACAPCGIVAFAMLLMGYLYPLLGIFSDLAENIFTVFFTDPAFSSYQIFVSFIAFDLANAIVTGSVTVANPTAGAILSALFEIAQGVVNIHFCGYLKISVIFLIIMTIFQVSGILTPIFVEGDKGGNGDQDSLDMMMNCMKCCQGACIVVMFGILGWAYTLGSPTGCYSSSTFQALLATYLWACSTAGDLQFDLTAGMMKSWMGSGGYGRGSGSDAPLLPELPGKRQLQMALYAYAYSFVYVAFAYGIRNLHNPQSSHADSGLCIFSIVEGSVILCSSCCALLRLSATGGSTGGDSRVSPF